MVSHGSLEVNLIGWIIYLGLLLASIICFIIYKKDKAKYEMFGGFGLFFLAIFIIFTILNFKKYF